MTSAPPRPDQSAPTTRPDLVPPARPSGAQIIASVLTAITTTFALSYFGVAGTIIGAGLASTFTVLANYWYTRTIVHTHRKVIQYAPRTIRHRETAQSNTPNEVPAPVDSEPVVTVGTNHNSAAASTTVETAAFDAVVGEQTALFDVPEDAAGSFSSTVPAAPSPDSSPAPSAKDGEALMGPARSGRRRFILPIIVLFVLLLGVVTAVEYGLGKPLSDAVRGKEGSGTSLSNVRTPGRAAPSTPDDEPVKAPGSDGTDTPSKQPAPEPSKPGPAETTPGVDPTDPTEPPAPGAGEPEKPIEPEAPAEILQPEGAGKPGDNAAGVQKPDHNPTDGPSTPADQPHSTPTADPARLIVSASRVADAE